MVVQFWSREIKSLPWKSHTELFLLPLLSFAALLVHGYHPFAEDAEIYLPGVEKILRPELFPTGTEFFESHAHLTLFPNLIAFSQRLTHLRLDVLLLLWQLASIYLLLLACWQLSGRCFSSARARWAGVSLIAALLTLPVAGTSLYVIDQYVNPRNLAAFAAVFGVCRVLEKRYVRAVLWLVFAAAVHPLMAVFALSLCILLAGMERFETGAVALAFLLPLGISFQPASPAYHQAALYHSFHYILRWQWYEWLGALGPIPIFWWFGRMARSRASRDLHRMCQALMIYDVAYFAGALILSVPKSFESLARFQPLRSLHLLYILMFLFAGGFLGEFILRNRVWRWLALFVPLCGGMFLAQRSLFPASAQVEWPGSSPKNEWAQAFLWIRGNTPVDASFALDPFYMQIPGEDTNGFRALAERSRLADALKDSGAVSMFPPLAEEWFQQFQAQRNWRHFGLSDFERLRTQYQIGWVVLQVPAVPDHGLDCPYRNHTVAVCRLRP